MKRKFNVKLFLWLLGITIVAGLAFHGVHELQARQTASGLLRMADQAEDKGNLNKASNYLGRYLKFVPEDTEALARLGLLFDKQAVKNPDLRERAFYILDQVLRRESGRLDVRRTAVRLAMTLRRYGDAKAHLAFLMAEAPSDGELFHLLGSCEAGAGKYADAVKALEKAIHHPPKEVESYVLLAAVLWRKRDDAKRADEVMQQLVKEKNSVPAYLARARYLRERGKIEVAPAEQDAFLKRAGEDIAAARKLAPDDIEVLVESAEWRLAQNKPGGAHDNTPLFEGARADLEHALKVRPKEPRLYSMLSRVERLAGKVEQATASLHRGLKEVPAENQADLLYTLADLLIDQDKLTEVGDLLDRLRKMHFPSAPIGFLDARVLMKKGDAWLEATRALETIHPLLGEWPLLNMRVEFLLGQCYEQLGDPDQQYTSFRRALSTDPLSIPALSGMGQALIAMGRPDDAMEAYRRLVPRVPEAKLMVARLLIERNLLLPKNQRVWDEVDTLLKELETVLQATPALHPELYLLKAEATAARGDLNRTREILLEARDRQPDKIDMWVALANLAIQKPQGGVEEAEAILDEAEQKFGDRIEIRLARAWQLRRGGKEAPQALVRLAEGADKFTAVDRRRLLRECGTMCAMLGDLGRAEQFFLRLEKMRPHDLTIKLALFDLALEAGKFEAVDTLIADMRRIEGTPGTRWRYARATRLIARAMKASSAEGLDEARSLLNALAVERPSWFRIAVSQGQVSELLGKRDTAIGQYLQAVDMGERNPAFIHRLCMLLYQSQRYADASKVLHRLPEGVVLVGDMRQLAVDLSLRSQDYRQALGLAEKAVQDNGKDYRNHLWLAQVYLAMNKETQAEPALREAVTLASDVPQTWVALVHYLVFTGQKEKAAAEIANAAKKLTAKEAPLALAQCYEAVGNREQALVNYQKALAAQPDDLTTLQGAADFSLRGGQIKDAEKYLRQIIALKHKNPEAAASAQRVLGLVLVIGGENYQKSREALVNLGILADSAKPTRPGAETIDELRAKAMTLALLKHRPDRLAAIRIFVQMRERQPLAANDQFLLAQLYDSVGDWAKARVELSELVNKDGKNFLYLTRLAQGLLLHGHFDAVAPLLVKLEESYATTAATAEIKARLLHAQDKAPQAVQVLRQYAEKNEDKLPVIAALLEELKQVDAAEDMFRLYVARSKAPESGLALARYLGRRGRLDEALEICQTAAPSCRAEIIAATGLNILYSANPTTEQRQRVEKLLLAALQKDRNAVLLDFLGAYHNLQGNYAEAETAFRDVLAIDGKDATALNNLSWLLAFQPQKNAEALQIIERTIKTIGPHASVLDTRGVIHVYAGRADEAVKDLEEVVAEAPSASHYFHLAQAHNLAKNAGRTMAAMAEANRLGLKESALHSLERTAYQRLCAQLGIEKK